MLSWGRSDLLNVSAISCHVLAQTLGCPNLCCIQKIHGSRRPISWHKHLLNEIIYATYSHIDRDHIRVRRCPNALRLGSHPPSVMESPNNMNTSSIGEAISSTLRVCVLGIGIRTTIQARTGRSDRSVNRKLPFTISRVYDFVSVRPP